MLGSSYILIVPLLQGEGSFYGIYSCDHCGFVLIMAVVIINIPQIICMTAAPFFKGLSVLKASVKAFGCWVWGLGFRVLGFGVQGLGFKV